MLHFIYRLVRTLLWLLVLALFCFALYGEAIAFARRKIEHLVIAPVELGDVSLSSGRVDLRDVSIAGGVVTAKRLSVIYTLANLWRGHVSAIEIERPHFKTSFDGQKLSLGPLDRLLAGEDGGEGDRSVTLPFDSLVMTGATIDIADQRGARDSSKKQPANPLLPLSYALSLRPAKDGLIFETRVADAGGRVLLTVSGQSDLLGRSVLAKVSTSPIIFKADGLQPSHFYAPLALMTTVSGKVTVHGSIAWQKNILKPDMDLLVENLAATIGPVSVQQASAVVKLTKLWPPETPADQVLSVAVIDVGLPLTNVEVKFRLDGQGNIAINHATVDVAKGRVSLSETSLPLDGGPFDLLLTTKGVDLNEVAHIVNLGGLTADGTLDGVIPAHIENGGILIQKARLESTAPAVLKYNPVQPPSALNVPEQGISLLLQALTDFRYKELRVDLDGPVDGDMNVGLHILGSNPDLYDGYPLEFNLNVNGPLTLIVRQGMDGYRIPDKIRAQILNSGKSPEKAKNKTQSKSIIGAKSKKKPENKKNSARRH